MVLDEQKDLEKMAQLATSRIFLGADEDHSHVPYEHSCGLRDIERKKIRQIFEEWQRTGMTANKTSICFIGKCIEIRKDHHEYQREDVKNPIQKLCGRQALVDILKTAKKDRREEIELLLMHRPVSLFSHRKLIQSLLKSRFLRNGRQDDSPRSATSTEGELNILRGRHSVSGLRKGFLSQSNFSAFLQPRTDRINTTSNGEKDNSFMTERSQPGSDEILHYCQKQSEGIDPNSFDGINLVTELARQTHEEEGDDYHETLENMMEVPSNQGSVPVQELQTLDEDDYPLEIQQLLRRRLVSTLLNTCFCTKLEKLLKSYVEKQRHASSKFDLDSSAAAENEDFERLSEAGSVDQGSTVENPPSWQECRSETDWDIIKAMKNDIARLQQRMSCLQEMVESCMDMQLQLQHLISR